MSKLKSVNPTLVLLSLFEPVSELLLILEKNRFLFNSRVFISIDFNKKWKNSYSLRKRFGTNLRPRSKIWEIAFKNFLLCLKLPYRKTLWPIL